MQAPRRPHGDTPCTESDGRGRTRGSHLVIPLAQELEPLGPFVHEDAVQVARLHRADLNGFLAPAHDLVGADVGWGRRAGGPVSGLQQWLRARGAAQGQAPRSPTEVGISPHCSTTSLMIRP